MANDGCEIVPMGGQPVEAVGQCLVLRLDRPEDEAGRIAAGVWALCTEDREMAGRVLALVRAVTANLPAGEFYTPEYDPHLGFWVRRG